MGGVVALLASVLSVSDAASALQLTISNTSSNGGMNAPDLGQSFKNDPAGSGTSILLNDWTFAFQDATSASDALTKSLKIYQGSGNNGTLLYSSTNTTSVTFGGFNDSVKWTFDGGVSLADNATYSAIIQGISGNIRISNSLNPYPNGDIVVGAEFSVPIQDTVFQANFSDATPVPFDFEPTGGLAVLGGAWLLRRHLKKKKA